ncbi:MAG: para-aminobenzoate synthetase component 1 [Candidatus Endobugula sp.]|jgi:para-aminobenzoate synthetase component 1
MPIHYHIVSIPYHCNSATLFDSIRCMQFAYWLDSGKPNSQTGRYDILSAHPSRRWVNENGQTIISDYHYTANVDNSYSIEISTKLTSEDPFTLIKQASEALTRAHLSAPPPTQDLPFIGGILSYFSYELGRQQLNVNQQSPSDCQLPDMVAGLYEWAIIQDHEKKCSYLVGLPECDKALLQSIERQISALSSLVRPENSTTFSINPLTSNINCHQYHEKMATINDYIHAGDCYQVNFAQRFSAEYQGDPYIAYLALREEMASPFSAFIDLGDKAILSFSPERFLQVIGSHVLTQPIKGTIARDSDPMLDKYNAQQLRGSSKNQAENVMIVDLLRNDLGKSCLPGSIHVPALFALESFPNVHHLVSNVEGELRSDKSVADLFKGCFPGGSITGAPKKRAMEIIEELEDSQRSIYCGSIAYFNSRGDMDSNITIRTIACDGATLYCWGGGGIVADSDAEDEYQESLTKINKILLALRRFEVDVVNASILD